MAGQPSEQVAERDLRSHPQRQHDALCALVRGQLGDPNLGQHHGLPVAVVVSTTLQQLTKAAGLGVTGGGSVWMADVIRMASHAWHYLAVFDEHSNRPLYLGRTKRIATADQRIVLHAKDRGCTHPGCDVPGYLAEVHHVDEWVTGGLTKSTNSPSAANRITSSPNRVAPVKLANGDTQWIPPRQLGLPGGVNTYYHPEKLLKDDDEDDDNAA